METTKTRFSLGAVFAATGNAVASLDAKDVLAGLARHANGDWGDLDPEDWEANEQAVRHGHRLLSVYRAKNGKKFWVMTDAERWVTTVLMPEDY